MFPKRYVSTALCSHSVMFPKCCSHSFTFPPLHVSTSLCSQSYMMYVPTNLSSLSSHSSRLIQLYCPYLPQLYLHTTLVHAALAVPTELCSRSSVFPQYYVHAALAVPTVLCSRSSVFPQYYVHAVLAVPTVLCSRSSVFPQYYVHAVLALSLIHI